MSRTASRSTARTLRRRGAHRFTTAVLVAAMALGLAACSDGTAHPRATTPPVQMSATDIAVGGPESVLAEFLEDVLAGRTLSWTGKDPTTVQDDISMYPGAEHCGWEAVIFLDVGAAAEARHFARDPRGVEAVVVRSTGSLATAVAMPADATDTGFRGAGVQLWFADSDPDGAYLTDGTTVERWPRMAEPLMCA